NQLLEDVLRVESENPKVEAAKLVEEMTADSMRLAMKEGDLNNGAVMAGQIVPLVKQIRPAKQIIDSILEECKQVLNRNLEFNFV
ncbi:MAG: hypothetical protein J6A39_06755, partial [Peptococcaceae bacterium]|nr:hypothetical protein [Peptococcaceae bacterium]